MAPPAPFTATAAGFAFTNSWPDEPAVSLATAMGDINVGNARDGLCGGMVFAALDYWYAGLTAPTEQPAKGTPLYKYIVKRIVDSWNVPIGVAQYFSWMNVPDGDRGFTAFGHKVVVEHGLSSRTITQQWPAVRADLDRGLLSPLGLVTVKSVNPADLGQNHQVLAYGYDVDGPTVSVRVYDPNSGQDDGVRISFSTANPGKATPFTHNIAIGHPIRGFFRTSYRPAKPPAA